MLKHKWLIINHKQYTYRPVKIVITDSTMADVLYMSNECFTGIKLIRMGEFPNYVLVNLVFSGFWAFVDWNFGNLSLYDFNCSIFLIFSWLRESKYNYFKPSDFPSDISIYLFKLALSFVFSMIFNLSSSAVLYKTDVFYSFSFGSILIFLWISLNCFKSYYHNFSLCLTDSSSNKFVDISAFNVFMKSILTINDYDLSRRLSINFVHLLNIYVELTNMLYRSLASASA